MVNEGVDVVVIIKLRRNDAVGGWLLRLVLLFLFIFEGCFVFRAFFFDVVIAK